MEVTQHRSAGQGQRNYLYKCNNNNCVVSEFKSQSRRCAKYGSNNCEEYPTCKICDSSIVPKNKKCSKHGCTSCEYANIFRTIQLKSSHEEDSGTIGFNFKLQDLVDDVRHFLVVYTRTFVEFKEKHNYWVMSIEEFKRECVKDNAATLIYQNNRLHPTTSSFFDEERYNRLRFLIQNFDSSVNHIDRKISLERELNQVDVFGKLNVQLNGDF